MPTQRIVANVTWPGCRVSPKYIPGYMHFAEIVLFEGAPLQIELPEERFRSHCHSAP